MTYGLGMLIAVVLAVLFGLLHRGMGPRDCRGCATDDERDECEACPLNSGRDTDTHGMRHLTLL